MACGFSLSPASFQIFVFSSSQGRTVSLSIFCLFADISGLFWEGVAGDTAEFFFPWSILLLGTHYPCFPGAFREPSFWNAGVPSRVRDLA